MKVVNLSPEFLNLGWVVNELPVRVHPPAGGLTATFFLKATFRLRAGATPERWPDKPDQPCGDVPMGGEPPGGIAYASDFIPFKPHGEFTVVGTGHNPAAQSGSFPVTVRVGDRQKTIAVVGDRSWKTSLLGAAPGFPAPVDQMPLTYVKAWGGPGSQTNPLGCGELGVGMPNLELPESPVTSRSTRVQPAGFAPIPPDWPLRREKLGTYDKDWLEERWPWWPGDFDWTYFNAAPPSQWFPDYLRGDEAMEFLNLHPEHPRYLTRLPGLRGRCFLTQMSNGEERFLEVPLVLDTLWADLASEKLILVWRGLASVASLKLRDVLHVMALLEPLGTVAHDYPQRLADALKPPPAPKEPENLPDFEKIAAAGRSRLAEAMERMAVLEKQADARQAEAEALQAKVMAGARGMAAREDSHVDYLEKLRAAISRAGSAPGVSAQQRESLAEALQEAGKIGNPREFFEEELKQAREQFGKAGAVAEPKPEAASPRTPEALAAAREQGFVGADLHGVDFSGLDLSGVDFSRALLAKANFTGARLTGAKLEGCDLSEANLTKCDLTGARLAGADFHGCTAAGAVWKKTHIDRAKFAGLDLAGAEFSAARGASADFSKAKLDGTVFIGAELPRARFTGASAQRINFTRARLSQADFGEASMQEGDFREADLTGFRAGRGADFTRSFFQRVSGGDSVWKGSILDAANFQQALLTRAQFSETCLKGTIFDRCDLRRATFEDAVIHGGVLTNANLLGVLFDRADLTDARLDGSNLYESGFWDTILLRATWSGANVKRTRLAV